MERVSLGMAMAVVMATTAACTAPAMVSDTAAIEQTLSYDFPYSGGDQPLYLKVTGSGVVAAGGECQIQRFGPDQLADSARLGGVPASQWVQACDPAAVYARAEVDGATAMSEFAATGLSRVFSCIGEGALVRRTGLGIYDVAFDDGGSDLDNIGIRFDLLGRTPTVTSQTPGVGASITGPFQCSFSVPPEVTCYRVETRDSGDNSVEGAFSIAFL